MTPQEAMTEKQKIEQEALEKLLKDWREGKYPDLSHFSAQEKADLISGCVQIAAKEIMMWFYSFGLKTHIECEVVNDPTNERFKFSFVKLPSQPPAGDDEYFRDHTREADNLGNVFIREANKQMIAFNFANFKKDYPTLFNVILSAMDEYSSLLKKENEELKAWKESAMLVMSPVQEIGQMIGVGLGESILDKVIPALEAKEKEIEYWKQRCEAAEYLLNG